MQGEIHIQLAAKTEEPKSKRPRTFVQGLADLGSSTWARSRDLRIEAMAAQQSAARARQSAGQRAYQAISTASATCARRQASNASVAMGRATR